jgi:TP901 family phage tail tape measure protein
MPEVQSDIKVLVTPVVSTTDLSTLRKQVEDAFKTPINVKINADSSASSIEGQIRTIQAKTVRAANAAMRQFNASEQLKKNFGDVERQATAYYKKFEANITRNASLSTKWADFLNRVKSPNFDTDSIRTYRRQLVELMNESRDANVEIEKTGQKLSRLFGQHLSTAVAVAAVHALRQSLRKVYDTIVELDKALVDLQVSSGKSRSELKSLMMQYSEFAKSLGTTTIAVTQAADTWLRQGYDLSEVETLITDSIHLSVLGKIDSEEATKALTSTMKGYGIAVQDASTIVDKFTTVDMNAATSAGDLATAMAECAVSAKLMGIDINNLTGYLAVVLETTGDGAESVGVFMKTLIARMANIKTGKLVDPEDQSDISDVERVLSNYGIALRDQQGNFRNFQQILDETAQKWRELGEAGKTSAQSAIAVAFGGTRNQEKFKVLMEGYQTAAKYADIATNSTGNAAEKYEAYMDGIEAHINQLTATFEKFSQTVLNSDMVKEGVDFLTNILNLLQQITAWSGNAGFGALTPLFGLGGGILGASGKGRLQQVGLAANMPLYALVATRNELAA